MFNFIPTPGQITEKLADEIEEFKDTGDFIPMAAKIQGLITEITGAFVIRFKENIFIGSIDERGSPAFKAGSEHWAWEDNLTGDGFTWVRCGGTRFRVYKGEYEVVN